MSDLLRLRLQRLQICGLAGGLACLAACGCGAIFNARQFYISYLFAILFWLGLALGCFGVAMIHHLSGGRWGDVTHRFFEAGYMTVPVLALLFVPIFFGLRELYPWARPAEVARDEILRHKAHYLNPTGFVLRAVFFFAIWIFLASRLRQWSRRQDETVDAMPTRRARSLSGPGLVIYPLTMTFAWIDWSMSLETDWQSTIFPIMVCLGQILAAFALAIVVLAGLKDQEPLSGRVNAGHFHQLGNLLLAFVMCWTYLCFAQFLIIWSGNLPREISWYSHRIAGNWKWVAVYLALFNFLLPFFLLLFRASKRQPQILGRLACVVFVSCAVNSFWLVEPAFFQAGIHIHWMDFAAPLGLGGIWMAAFIHALKRAPLLTRNVPGNSIRNSHA